MGETVEDEEQLVPVLVERRRKGGNGQYGRDAEDGRVFVGEETTTKARNDPITTEWVGCVKKNMTSYGTKENKKYIKSVLDLFSIPNFYIRKGRPHGHRYGKKGDQEYHTANQLQKKCKKRHFLSIHDRFIRDTWFRKTMLELGRTEEVIREMDKLANENHTHIATEEELNVYRSNWWIRSNFVGSDTMPIRHRPDFKEALSTLRGLKNAYYQAYYHHDDGLDTDGAVKPAKISK